MKVKTAKKTVKYNTVQQKSVKVAPITVKKAVFRLSERPLLI